MIARIIEFSIRNRFLVLMLTGWGKQMAMNDEDVPHADLIMAKPPKPAELESALRKLCRG